MKHLTLLTALLALTHPLPAQQKGKQETGKAASGLNACQLLPNADVVRVTGRKSYVDAQLTSGGSGCSYDDAQLQIYAGPTAEQQWESVMKAFGQDKIPRTPIAGLGESAYSIYPPPRNKYQDASAFVVVKQGRYLVTMAVAAPDGKTPQSVQPQALELAKIVLAKLK